VDEQAKRVADTLVELTADIVGAYVSNNPVPPANLPVLISDMHASLSSLVTSLPQQAAAKSKQKPAVAIKKSVTPDYLISLEDGKKFKSLKRHLATSYGMTPDQYRAKWDLSADYPMVAPNYAAARSRLAKELGLGRPAKKAKAKR